MTKASFAIAAVVLLACRTPSTAEAEVHKYRKPEDREARIGEAVRRILARFPRH